MPSPTLWTRLRRARLFRVLAVYGGASWVVLQVVDLVQGLLLLPDWLGPVSLLLLLVGLIIIVATALVQGNPETDEKEEAGEVPGSWEIAPRELGQSLKAGKLPHLTWGRTLLGGLAAFWFLFGLAGLYVLVQDRGETFAPTEAIAEEAGTGLAVLPFQVQGSQELLQWREGLVDLFSTNLDGIGGFRTVASRTVLARWGEQIGDDVDPDLATTLGVARGAGAEFALVGTAVGLGSNVRLAADVYDVNTGVEIGQAQVEGAAEDVMSLVDQLSVGVMRALLGGASAELPPVQHTASMTTSSLPALRAYLESESYYRQSDFPRAIEALERAIQADPEFALAYYRLSDAYGWVETIGSEQGITYMRKAQELSDRLPPRYAALLNGAVALLEGDLSQVEAMEQAVGRYPDDPEMWFLLGEMYYHYAGETLTSLDDADRVFSKAVALDPTFAPYYLHLIEVTIRQRDQERTQQLLDRYLEWTYEPRSRDYLVMGSNLVFGDSALVAESRAAMDTLGTSGGLQLGGQLGVSGLGAENMHALSVTFSRKASGSQSTDFLIGTSLATGRVEDAVRLLDNPDLNPGSRAFRTFITQKTTGSVPDETVARNVTLEACGDHPGLNCAWAVGVTELERGNTDAFEAVLDLHARLIDTLNVRGDSVHARAHANQIVALRAYHSWLDGRTAEALTMLESVQGDGAGGDQPIRATLAEVHEELGQLRQAIRYQESFWNDELRWYTAWRLGDLYARLGDNDRARYYYALFLEDWAHADPGRPEVEHARAQLNALGG